MNGVHVKLREWQAVGPATAEPIPELVAFRFESANDRRLAESLTRARILLFQERHDGLQIRAAAHVGRVQLGRLTVTIVPKIGASDLLGLVRYAYGLRDIQLLRAARYGTTGHLLQDLLVAQLYAETRTLLERGIARAYISRDDDLANPRGQIDFSRLALQGGQAAAQLPCRHYPRASDHILNRALLAGVAHARTLVQDPVLRADLGQLERTLAELAGRVPLTSHLIREAARKLNRLVVPYASGLRIIELLYQGNRLDLEAAEGGQPLPGFLFDMNRFFQHLLQRFLTENLPPPLSLEPESRLSDIFRYVPDENPRERSTPTPRPDYAIKVGSRVVALLDAKYRDLWELPLPRDMLYQLSVYALSQQRGSTAAILYPATDRAARPARIEIRDPLGSSTAGYVALRPVLLSRMTELVHANTPVSRRERALWAAELAGAHSQTARA